MYLKAIKWGIQALASIDRQDWKAIETAIMAQVSSTQNPTGREKFDAVVSYSIVNVLKARTPMWLAQTVVQVVFALLRQANRA